MNSETRPQESAALEFKASFDVKTDWPELIKDIVAMANSGGGKILVGVDDDGNHSGSDVTKLLGTDLADVVNKIRGFTDVNFALVSITPREFGGRDIAEIVVGAAPTPLVFGKAGNYTDANNKPQCAFRQGMLYMRHGPKSEPATTDDVRSIIEAKVEAQRNSLLANVRQVIEAPTDAIVTIAAPIAVPSESADAIEVQLTDGPTRRDAVLLDPNILHPHRQKEVVENVNAQLKGSAKFTTTDNGAIRKLCGVEKQKKYFYRPKFGSAQYSEAYVTWLVGQIKGNPKFLSDIRQKFHDFTVASNRQRRTGQDWASRGSQWPQS